MEGEVGRGLRNMVGAAFFFATMSACVKLVGTRVPTHEVVLVRAAILAALSAIPLLVRRRSFRGSRQGLLVLRGILGVIALFCFFSAVVQLPLADATVIQYTSPAFTAVLAALVLGEGLGLKQSFLVVCSLLGVLLVARPEFLSSGATLDPFWVLVGLLGAVFSAGAYVTVRKLAPVEDAMVIVLYFAVISFLAMVPLVLREWVPPTPREWGLLAAMGVSTQLGQVFLTRGLRWAPAGQAMAVGYVQIVFAGIWGVAVFGERPDLLGIIGTFVVILSTWGLMRSRRPVRGKVASGAGRV